MSEVKTNNPRNGSNTTDEGCFIVLLAFLSVPFRIVGSLTFGIALLATLLVLMAFGTFVESEYGTTVANFILYGNFRFHLLIALLALNLVGGIILRFSKGRHKIPFLMAHIGILVLLFGCYLTWQHGVEAQITLPEGTVGSVAVKLEQQQLDFKYLVHSVANTPKPLRSPFRPGPFSWQDYQWENWIKDNKRWKWILWHAMRYIHRDTGEKVVSGEAPGDPSIKYEILDYYASSALETVEPFDMSILWNKTVQTVTELGDAKEVPRNWEQVRLDLRQQHFVSGLSGIRGVGTRMKGEERISYSLALSDTELTAFQKSRPQGGSNAGLWGEIVLFYGGNSYSINVDQLIALMDNRRFPVGATGLQIGNVNFSDRMPVINFVLFTQSGEHEAMTLFPDNPELNVQARKLGVFGSYWVDPQRIMQEKAEHADHPQLQRLAVQRLDFMQGPDKKLHYRLWSGQKIVADGVVPGREGQKKPQFKIAEKTPDEVEIVIDRFVPQDVPHSRIVPATIRRDRQNEQRVKLRVTFDGKEDTFWLRAAAPTVVPLPPEQDQIRFVYGNGRTLCVQLGYETIELGFGILLKQFEKRTEPGMRMSSHYSSLVDYVEPIDPSDTASRNLKNYQVLPDGENILISMNQPGYYTGTGRGYRIYQSSYIGPFYPDQPQFDELYDGTVFPWESRPRESIAMSTLSVNNDPGRGWKYFGSFLIVLGTAMFVWRKRW
jgi:hypothetical protein